MSAYDDSPAKLTRGIKDASRLPPGDPVKMVKLMIDSVDQNPAPRRIVLGNDSYAAIRKALTERLADLA